MQYKSFSLVNIVGSLCVKVNKKGKINVFFWNYFNWRLSNVRYMFEATDLPTPMFAPAFVLNNLYVFCFLALNLLYLMKVIIDLHF